jgi:hypothetical protein
MYAYFSHDDSTVLHSQAVLGQPLLADDRAEPWMIGPVLILDHEDRDRFSSHHAEAYQSRDSIVKG